MRFGDLGARAAAREYALQQTYFLLPCFSRWEQNALRIPEMRFSAKPRWSPPPLSRHSNTKSVKASRCGCVVIAQFYFVCPDPPSDTQVPIR